MNKLLLLPIIMLVTFLASHALADPSTAARIVELKGGSESLWVFLARLPTSFEAQVFYALFGSGVIGSLGSWLWKWSQGVADASHFTARYVAGQVLWLVGASVAAIFTVGFQTEDGVFFGWLSVLWAGGFAGFSGEIKFKKPDAQS